MSARKKPQKSQGTGKPSERHTSKFKRPNQGKSRTEKFPDLDAIYQCVFHAYAIARCASTALDEYDGEGNNRAAFFALYPGVEALGKAVDHLEKATEQLGRFQRAGGAL